MILAIVTLDVRFARLQEIESLQHQPKCGAGALMILDIELAVDGGHSFLHVMEAVAELPQLVHIDADAVVLDLDGQLVGDGDIDLDHVALGMF